MNITELTSLSYIELLFIVSGYLLGSISSAIIISRLMGLPDPRQGGSKNPGATNMLRLSGKKVAVVTLLGDVLKGVIPVLAAKIYGVSDVALILTALCAFLGHLYPLFFHFKGGKGVATALGVLLAAYWPIGLFTCIVWITIYFFMRVSSVAALTAFLLTPAFVLFTHYPRSVVIVTAIMTLFIFWRHRSNIVNLIHGNEGDPHHNK